MDEIVKLEKQKRLLTWIAAIVGLVALLTVAATAGLTCVLLCRSRRLPLGFALCVALYAVLYRCARSKPTLNPHPTSTHRPPTPPTHTRSYAVVALSKEVSTSSGVLVTPAGQSIQTGLFALEVSPDAGALEGADAATISAGRRLTAVSDGRRRSLLQLGTVIASDGACYTDKGRLLRSAVDQLCGQITAGVDTVLMRLVDGKVGVVGGGGGGWWWGGGSGPPPNLCCYFVVALVLFLGFVLCFTILIQSINQRILRPKLDPHPPAHPPPTATVPREEGQGLPGHQHPDLRLRAQVRDPRRRARGRGQAGHRRGAQPVHEQQQLAGRVRGPGADRRGRREDEHDL